MQRWIQTIKEDPATPGELFIELPEEVCEYLNINVGDSINWVDNKDGSFTLVKVDKSSEL